MTTVMAVGTKMARVRTFFAGRVAGVLLFMVRFRLVSPGPVVEASTVYVLGVTSVRLARRGLGAPSRSAAVRAPMTSVAAAARGEERRIGAAIAAGDRWVVWHFTSFGPKRESMARMQADADLPPVIRFRRPRDLERWIADTTSCP